MRLRHLGVRDSSESKDGEGQREIQSAFSQGNATEYGVGLSAAISSPNPAYQPVGEGNPFQGRRSLRLPAPAFTKIWQTAAPSESPTNPFPRRQKVRARRRGRKERAAPEGSTTEPPLPSSRYPGTHGLGAHQPPERRADEGAVEGGEARGGQRGGGSGGAAAGPHGAGQPGHAAGTGTGTARHGSGRPQRRLRGGGPGGSLPPPTLRLSRARARPAPSGRGLPGLPPGQPHGGERGYNLLVAADGVWRPGSCPC